MRIDPRLRGVDAEEPLVPSFDGRYPALLDAASRPDDCSG
jgi:hypothetical protein